MMPGATASPALDELPLRPELVGEVPYGAPVSANVTVSREGTNAKPAGTVAFT